MVARVICPPGSNGLGEALARALGVPLAKTSLERFPDGELRVVIHDALMGEEVALLQPLSQPVGERLLELTLFADACQRAGAASWIAVLPYLAYARQDRLTERGGAIGGQALGRLVSASGFSRVVTVDLHSVAAEHWFTMRVDHLSATELLAEAVRPHVLPGTVVVSPDLGGVKRAERVARQLGLPLAILHKERRSGREVSIHRVLGDVQGRPLLIVDDLISTAGTICAAVTALRSEHAATEVSVLATHALLVDGAVERLRKAGIRRLVHTDSLPVTGSLPFEHVVVPLAPLLADGLRGRVLKD